MAQGKKSFIAYSDWRDIFTELPDEEAGKLIKHIFAYVNDESPVSDSVLIRASFASIKSTLKRDLEKWDKQLQQRIEAGIQSGISRATKSNERSKVVNETERNPTVSVSVNVSDIDNKLLSEIDISDVDDSLKDYFNIAKEFNRLFILNLKEKSISSVTQEKAKFKKSITPIRLMIQNKEATLEDLRDVFTYLASPEGEFWKTNILSTSKLREKLPTILMNARKPKEKIA